MAVRHIHFSDIPDLVGTELGTSREVVIDQARINGFADVTEDHQWIHVDEKKAADSPFGGTIAHGYLTPSLASALIFDLLEFEGVDQVINYGLNHARFTAPVPSGSSVSLTAKVGDVTECRGGYQMDLDCEFRVTGAERPACVATIVFRAYGQE